MMSLLSAGLWALVGLALAPLIRTALVILTAQALAEGQTVACPYSGKQIILHLCGRVWCVSLRIMAIGVVMACIFGWLAWRHGLSWMTFVLSIYIIIFLIIVCIDLEHRLILNCVLVPSAAFALLVAPTLAHINLIRAVLGAAVGFLFFLLPALIMPGGLGGGDVKLAGFLGLVTGFPAILWALTAGAVLGGVTTLLLLLMRRIRRHDYIPYGPFLIAGAILVLMGW